MLTNRIFLVIIKVCMSTVCVPNVVFLHELLGNEVLKPHLLEEFLESQWMRAGWRAKEMASSIDLFDPFAIVMSR